MVRRMYNHPSEADEMDNQISSSQILSQSMNKLPMRDNLNEMQYAQLFFVVGHTAIKMLACVETIERTVKMKLKEKS
jgi:hypothetical protein